MSEEAAAPEEAPANIVIPDSIEYVEGWKGFDVSGNHLYSPSKTTQWPYLAPLQATCPGIGRGEYVWEPVKYGNPSFVGEHHIHGYGYVTYGYPTAIPEKPHAILPPGYEWNLVWKEYPHEQAPSEKCSCGIYMADSIEEALSYGLLVAKCAGWGKVVKHTSGYRVEYAYPLELYVPADSYRKKVARYGVPVMDLGDLDPVRALAPPGVAVTTPIVKRTPLGLKVFYGALVALLAALVAVNVGLFINEPTIVSGFAAIFTALIATFTSVIFIDLIRY